MDIIKKMRDSGWTNIVRQGYNVEDLLHINHKYNGGTEENKSIIAETRDVIIAFNLGMTSKEKREEALKIIKPVTFLQANNFINRAERFIDKNQEFITYPKTNNGILNAYVNVILNGDITDVCFILGVDEENTIKAYKSIDYNKIIINDRKNNFKLIHELINEINELELSNNNNKHIVDAHIETIKESNDIIPIKNEIKKNDEEESKIKNKQPVYFYKHDQNSYNEMEKLTDIINDILKPIREDISSYPKNKDFASFKINQAIDDSARNYNLHNGDLSEWFSKILLENQYNILYNTNKDHDDKITYFSKLYLEMFIDCSSELNDMGLDTAKVLKDKNFWYGIKVARENLPNIDYKIFTNNLLTRFLTLKDYSDELKIEIGNDAVGSVFKDEINFKSRLNLWLDIGGDLTIKNNQGKTIVDILKSKKNEMWNNSIIKIAKERDVNLHNHFPNQFDRIGTFVPKKEDIIISRKSDKPF